jgi:hypothetical protein
MSGDGGKLSETSKEFVIGSSNAENCRQVGPIVGLIMEGSLPVHLHQGLARRMVA